MQITIFIILLLYVLLILKFTIGWYKTEKSENSNFTSKVSVVIALRNEESKIEKLLKDLQSIIYPADKIEFFGKWLHPRAKLKKTDPT